MFLATSGGLKNELGNLSRVKRIVKVLGMVQCVDTFTEQPKVINGFSDLMVEVFGEKGESNKTSPLEDSILEELFPRGEIMVLMDADMLEILSCSSSRLT